MHTSALLKLIFTEIGNHLIICRFSYKTSASNVFLSVYCTSFYLNWGADKWRWPVLSLKRKTKFDTQFCDIYEKASNQNESILSDKSRFIYKKINQIWQSVFLDSSQIKSASNQSFVLLQFLQTDLHTHTCMKLSVGGEGNYWKNSVKSKIRQLRKDRVIGRGKRPPLGPRMSPSFFDCSIYA